MDIQEAAFNYLTHIFETESAPKMLILDKQTLDFISVAMTKTELFKNEVCLVETIDFFKKQPDKQLATFTCYCLIRPTQDNIDLLCEELKCPKFPKYCIFFTESLDNQIIHRIAASDANASIENFQEVYLDFSALGKKLFSLNLPDISPFRFFPTNISHADRIIEGLFGAISSLRIKPIIRYDQNSAVTKPVALGLNQMVQEHKEFYSGRNVDNACVLILDRRNDPVTPLLHFFHFMSTIHDLFTISNNIIKIGSQYYTIDERLDPETETIGAMFLKEAGESIHARSGKITAMKNEKLTKDDLNNNQKLLSYIKTSDTFAYVSTFVTLYNSLFETVQSQQLMDVTNLEQYIATSNDPSGQLDELKQLIQSPHVTKEAALRLGLIYVLKYEKSSPNCVTDIINALRVKGSYDHGEMRYFQTLIRIAGQDKRTGDIFSNKSIVAQFKQGLANLKQKYQYERFKPPLQKILQDITDNRLDERTYPFADKKGPYQKTIIFIIGGATYEEHKLVIDFSQNGNHSFVLGGTTIHNPESFLRYEVAPYC